MGFPDVEGNLSRSEEDRFMNSAFIRTGMMRGRWRRCVLKIRSGVKVETVDFGTITLSYDGIWSQKSAEDLRSRKIIKASELKIIYSRAGFWRFNKTTDVERRTGVG